jgi:hypothetical protein
VFHAACTFGANASQSSGASSILLGIAIVLVTSQMTLQVIRTLDIPIGGVEFDAANLL